ncbi:MAG: twin-arginine translocase subunit TatB [Proteobacteria bacterium]|nr:twin-arginine translocase subunit TatB [Pseudomonadota bacterium]
MLDIGFSEIALIFTLALIVLGPEKLPRVASQVGRWIGRARGMARQFREQLEEEVNLEETRRSRPAAVTPPPPAATLEAPPPGATADPAPTSHSASATAEPAPACDSGAAEPPAESSQPTYPDHYSHAHPTDSDGRPLPASGDPAPDPSGQQDWIGGGSPTGNGVPSADNLTVTDKPAQSSPAPGYASPHERGT